MTFGAKSLFFSFFKKTHEGKDNVMEGKSLYVSKMHNEMSDIFDHFASAFRDFKVNTLFFFLKGVSY